MERTLWRPERLTEFGPNPFSVQEEPRISEVHGVRPRVLKSAVQSTCENVPGVYGMLDKDGILIYVGKSKTLRTRLLSYFSPKVRNQKPGRMIRQARGIMWEPAPSEFAALLRELQLIQHWRPRLNVKDMPLRARSTFVCLGRPTAPGILLSSKPAPSMLATFGPMFGSRRLTRAVEALNRLFLLRDCVNSQPMAFSDQNKLFPKEDRPGCLRFELQTCLGPCVSACSQEVYSKKVQQARRFLEGKADAPLAGLQKRMEQAAAHRQYELAARLRDDLAALCHLKERLDRLRSAQAEYHFVYPVSAENGDTIWYLIRGGRVAAVTKAPKDQPPPKPSANSWSARSPSTVPSTT
jgi:excinuclease ABC subunit C